MPFETAQITGGKSPDIQISIYPAVAQITWTWEDEEGIVQDYEHFSIPFILTVDKVLGKIRNSTLYYGNGGSFIPGTIENALEHKGPQFHYRNECLCRGMVNFNMIDVYIICHVASDTSQVASSHPILQCTCATNDHRLHPCHVPSQSQVSHHRHTILHRL